MMEDIQQRCKGYTTVLRRLYSNTVKAIQQFCGGYTTMLQSVLGQVYQSVPRGGSQGKREVNTLVSCIPLTSCIELNYTLCDIQVGTEYNINIAMKA